MSTQIITSDLLEELSAEQQQLLAGGQRGFEDQQFDDQQFEDQQFDDQQFDGEGREDRQDFTPSRGRSVKRVPIRLTGVLEVIK
ncbi:MAG: hypothetical protein KME59_24350 [Trichormus sp. ATA11-4-KO1]|jgi:hypothetical protein|nr:hypothetical protein [Trichormus sp. ATA11-4-KO1]